MVGYYQRQTWSVLTCGCLALVVAFSSSAFGQYNQLARKDGAVAGDKLGWTVAGAGDVNKDGKQDYIVGIPYADPGGFASAGSAIVYSGATGAVLFQINGSAQAQGFGYYVGGAGDVNGDGRADFMVADQLHAYIYSGANAALLYRVTGGGPVAGLGDISGDGRSDFIVSDLSQSYVYSGANGALLYQKAGGSAVAGVGDVNGDGRADFLIGDQYADPGSTNAGSAYMYSGANGALLYQKNGLHGSDLLGGSVAGVGDVNGDGRPDFIVGARLANDGGTASGAAYVYSGATGALLYTKVGAAGEQWGQAVGGAGDVNGDGRGDFLVSSIWMSPGGHTSAGSVMLFSGANGGLLQQFDGTEEYENFGYTLAGTGDINGDGRSDFIVGGPNASPGGRLNAGSAFVYGGGTAGDPCDYDVTPPILNCVADKQIGCGQSPVFDQPTATDNCDPSPSVSIVSTTQTNGPGAGEITYTRTWIATDQSGNKSAPCSQDIVYSCVQTQADWSQLTTDVATCSDFVGHTAGDVTDVCYSVKRSKISSCSPGKFYYYAAVTAPSANFTVDIVQTRFSTSVPLFDVARHGITVYDDCVSIGSGTSPSAGQAQVAFKGATAGRQYVIAVLYSSSSLTGTPVSSSGLNLAQHYDFAAKINGQTSSQDADGIGIEACVQTRNGKGPNGAPIELAVSSYPNPFNISTAVDFYLPTDGAVRVSIYNVLGREIRTLVNDYRAAGEYSITWSGTDDNGRVVPSGIYFLRVATSDDAVVSKLNLLK